MWKRHFGGVYIELEDDGKYELINVPIMKQTISQQAICMEIFQHETREKTVYSSKDHAANGHHAGAKITKWIVDAELVYSVGAVFAQIAF